MSTREFSSATVTRILSPTEWVDKQMDGMKTSGRKNYLIGIAHPKRDPIEAGSTQDSEDAYQASLAIAFAEERRRKGVAASSIQEWHTYAKEIGADKLVAGVTKRIAKVQDFVNAWSPVLQSHLSALDKMPTATLDDRIAKMGENARGLNALKGTGKGY